MPINEGQFNTERHDEHGINKPVPHPSPKTDAEHPGYEVTDVNAKGVVVFLGGLVGFLVVFFVLCYAMGKAINFGLLKQDGDEASTNPQAALAGGSSAGLHRGQSLESSTAMEQSEAAVITKAFPTPRLDADDSDQSTADLHAREDLLLENYTAIDPGQGTPGGVRIPIDVAMQLVVKRGLPANNGSSAPQLQTASMVGDSTPTAKVPLTNGFARTAYELDKIEERGQKMAMEHPAAEQHAKLEK